jgi:hypothetical protein
MRLCCPGAAPGADGASGNGRVEAKAGKAASGARQPVSDCCDAGSCCFGEVLAQSERAELEVGPVLCEWRSRDVVVPRHSVVELSVSLELGDAVAWAVAAQGGCHLSGTPVALACHWFDCSDGAAAPRERETYGVGDLWPARELHPGAPPAVGSFSLSGDDAHNATRATLVLTLDNRRNAVESRVVRVTLQQRGWHVGKAVLSPYGPGVVVGWAEGTFEVKLSFGTAFVPASAVVAGAALAERCGREIAIVRPAASIRMQHMHQPYRFAVPLGALGLHKVGGNFEWATGAQEQLWPSLDAADKKVLAAAFEDGFDLDQVVDYHVHIVGSGANGSGRSSIGCGIRFCWPDCQASRSDGGRKEPIN